MERWRVRQRYGEMESKRVRERDIWRDGEEDRVRYGE